MSAPLQPILDAPRRPWVVAGPGAADALAAHVANVQAQAARTAVFAFRVGQRARGTDPDRLAYRLLAWLRGIGGHHEPLPTRPDAIAERLPNWLARAASARPLLIAVSGIERLQLAADAPLPRWWLGWRPPGCSIVLATADAAMATRCVEAGASRVDIDTHAPTPWPDVVEPVDAASAALLERAWALADAGQVHALRALLCDPADLADLDTAATRYDVHRWLRELAPGLGGADAVLAPLREAITALPRPEQCAAWLGAARRVSAIDAEADTAPWIAAARAADPDDPDALLAEVSRLNARGQHEQAATLASTAPSPSGPLAWALRHQRAVAAESVGDLATAEALYLQTLKAVEDEHGPDAAELLPHLANLAGVQQARQDPAAARPWRERAASIARACFGDVDPRTAAALDALGGLAYAAGDAATAARHYREALQVVEAAFGPDHPATAAALGNLGTALDAQSDYVQAEDLHRRALAIREAHHGRVHEDTAASRHNLAAVLDERGRKDEAEALYREAIDDWRQLVGDDHPATATSRNNLADLLAERGDSTAAAALYRANLHTFSARYGDHHPHAVLSQTELGACLCRIGEFTEGEALLREAVSLTAQVMGETSLGHVDALCKLAVALRAAGRSDEARALLDGAVERLEPKLGVISPRLLRLRRQREALDAPQVDLH